MNSKVKWVGLAVLVLIALIGGVVVGVTYERAPEFFPVIIPCAIVFIAGSAGGAIRGLVFDKSNYTFNLPISNRQIQVGILGDIACGAAGGFVIFLIAASLMRENIQKVTTQADALIQIIGLTLLSGFAGIPILEALSNKLMQQLRQDIERIEDSVDKLKVRRASDDLVRLGEFHMSQQNYKTAIQFFSEALRADSTNDFALTRRAYAWKRLDSIQNALEDVTKATKLNPENARAWYNMGCYFNLMGRPLNEVLEPLQRAAKLSPQIYNEIAIHDPDLESIRDRTEFKTVFPNSLPQPIPGVSET